MAVPESRLYVALRRVAPFAPWTVRGRAPGLRAVGTVVAPSLAAARRIATERLRDPDGGELRVVRAGALPRGVLMQALAADGASRVVGRGEQLGRPG